MEKSKDLPIIAFETQPDWEVWLAEHATTSPGVWLKIAKKTAGVVTISYEQALEGALCYGWIDSQKVAFDEYSWLQKFTPRGTRSIWSQINCRKALALIEAGKMQPPGLRQVELAQADGRWEAAYASQNSATVPADLQAALAENAQARDFFLTLDSRNRYAILFRIQTAKKTETRAARIQKFVEMLAKHEKIYP